MFKYQLSKFSLFLNIYLLFLEIDPIFGVCQSLRYGEKGSFWITKTIQCQ